VLRSRVAMLREHFMFICGCCGKDEGMLLMQFVDMGLDDWSLEKTAGR
jgi:hypothetical protein